MTTVETIAEAARALPPEKQRELLEFAEFLLQRHGLRQPLHGVGGLCEDLGIDLAAADVDQARREIWGTFPREDL